MSETKGGRERERESEKEREEMEKSLTRKKGEIEFQQKSKN